MDNMIPKIVHYCWFGPNKMPKKVLKCIRSWKRNLPDYKFMLWNEKNFDVNQNLYTKQAYDSKKYAFVTDYVRLFALKKFGGIYMDADMEVLRNLDVFLTHSAFTGCENKYVPTAIMGAEDNHPWICRLLKYYDNVPFLKDDGTYNLRTNVSIITEITKKEYNWEHSNNIQELKNSLIIYPTEYFCPYNWMTKELNLTDNSYCIHHFTGSWLPKKTYCSRIRHYLKLRMINALIKLLRERKYLDLKGKIIK
jgi:mannosyltransferase OCH1-like enzyme